MEFEVIPAAEVSLAEQARLANEAFAGYVGGWADLDATTLARFLCLQGADLFYSRLVRNPAGLVGFGYINRTGNILRLGGMAIVPAARGTSAAARLLEQLFADANANGDATMTLEVIEQNPRAIALYRRHGFQQITRLQGWRKSGNSAGAEKCQTAIEEIPVLEALRT